MSISFGMISEGFWYQNISRIPLVQAISESARGEELRTTSLPGAGQDLGLRVRTWNSRRKALTYPTPNVVNFDLTQFIVVGYLSDAPAAHLGSQCDGCIVPSFPLVPKVKSEFDGD
jgi:hypothetical protein